MPKRVLAASLEIATASAALRNAATTDAAISYHIEPWGAFYVVKCYRVGSDGRIRSKGCAPLHPHLLR
jgi:hypothetical protein